jgi:hypothetical protein
MKRCSQCGSRFGLVKHYHYRLAFCSGRCKRLYLAEAVLRARRAVFFRWLFLSDPFLR